MTTINAYLNFNGNCEEAFNFYKSVFGGEFSYIGRFKDMPSETPVPDSVKEKIMHVELPISKETVLMGSDTDEVYSPKVTFGNNISLYVNAATKDEAMRLFTSLSEGGLVTMPIGKTFWAALFGSFTDKFDINWMVSFDDGESL